MYIPMRHWSGSDEQSSEVKILVAVTLLRTGWYHWYIYGEVTSPQSHQLRYALADVRSRGPKDLWPPTFFHTQQRWLNFDYWYLLTVGSPFFYRSSWRFQRRPTCISVSQPTLILGFSIPRTLFIRIYFPHFLILISHSLAQIFIMLCQVLVDSALDLCDQYETRSIPGVIILSQTSTILLIRCRSVLISWSWIRIMFKWSSLVVDIGI